MTWTPSDALVEKAARAAFDVTPVAVKGQAGPLTWGQCGAALKKNFRDEARAALLACRDDLVAEAVRAEREQTDRLHEQWGDVSNALRATLETIDNLIGNSAGVTGLHLNGDVAPWDELLTGGRFDDWLRQLDEARDLLLRQEEHP